MKSSVWDTCFEHQHDFIWYKLHPRGILSRFAKWIVKKSSLEISCNVHVRLYLLSTGSARTEQNHLPTKILGIQAKHQLFFLQIVVTVKQTLAKFQHDFSKYSIIHCFYLARTFSMKWGNEIRNFSARRFVHSTKRRHVASFLLEKNFS